MTNPLEHIFIKNNSVSLKYTTTQTARGASNIPSRDRQEHAARLLTQFDQIWEWAKTLKAY